MGHGGDMIGRLVSESEVAGAMGYSVEDYRKWVAAGYPTGRCSNPHCWRPAVWPELEKPCKYCGQAIKTDVKGERDN